MPGHPQPELLTRLPEGHRQVVTARQAELAPDDLAGPARAFRAMNVPAPPPIPAVDPACPADGPAWASRWPAGSTRRSAAVKAQLHQVERPWVVDSGKVEQTFG